MRPTDVVFLRLLLDTGGDVRVPASIIASEPRVAGYWSGSLFEPTMSWARFQPAECWDSEVVQPIT